MTYHDAYAEGFCKAAEALGVDPVALYKRADAKAKILGWLASAGKPAEARAVKRAGVLDTLIGGPDGTPGIVPKLLANEHLRRAALGAAVSGTTAALASGDGHRLRNALLAAGLGGIGTYGASATGVLDNALTPFRSVNKPIRGVSRKVTAMEIARKMRRPDPNSPYERFRESGMQHFSQPHVQSQLDRFNESLG